jgi:hypothetical protein
MFGETLPWSGVLETLIFSQPVKNFREFYGIRRFITMFTTVSHLDPDQSSPPS